MSGMPEFTVRSFSLSVPYFKTLLNLAGGSKTRFTNVLSALQAFLCSRSCWNQFAAVTELLHNSIM
jgi:hypothetical protein